MEDQMANKEVLSDLHNEQIPNEIREAVKAGELSFDKGLDGALEQVAVEEFKPPFSITFMGEVLPLETVEKVLSEEFGGDELVFSKEELVTGLVFQDAKYELVEKRAQGNEGILEQIKERRDFIKTTIREVLSGNETTSPFLDKIDETTRRLNMLFSDKRAKATGIALTSALVLASCTSGGGGEVIAPTDTGVSTGPTPSAAEVMPAEPTSFVEQGPEATQAPTQESVSYRAEDLTVEMVKEAMGAGGEYPAGFYIENESGEKVLTPDVQAVVDKIQSLMDGSGVKGNILTNGKEGDDFRWAMAGGNGEWLMIKNDNNEWVFAERPDLHPGLDAQTDEFKYGLPEKLDSKNTFIPLQLGTEDWFLVEVNVSGDPVRALSKETSEMVNLIGAVVEVKIPEGAENHEELAVPDRYVTIVNDEGKTEEILESGVKVLVNPETGKYEYELVDGEWREYIPRVMVVGEDYAGYIESVDVPSQVIETASETIEKAILFTREGTKEEISTGYDEVFGKREFAGRTMISWYGVLCGVKKQDTSIYGFLGVEMISGDKLLVNMQFNMISESDVSGSSFVFRSGVVPDKLSNIETLNSVGIRLLSKEISEGIEAAPLGTVLFITSVVTSDSQGDEFNAELDEIGEAFKTREFLGSSGSSVWYPNQFGASEEFWKFLD